jgi:hypothetical protein
MMETILASSPESLHGLTMQIQTTTHKDFDGENVIELVIFAHGALEQLHNNNALPVDILSIMANALKQCETPDFISYIARMYNNHVQHVKACTVGNMLSSAKQEYIALVTTKKWTVSLTNTAAVNVAGAGTKAAASVGTTTSDDTSSSLTLQDKSTHAPQTAGFAGLHF